MKLNGKLGPPVGAVIGLIFGAWTAVAEMPGYAISVRIAMPIIFTAIGLLAGLIVWWLDRVSSAETKEGDENKYCCAKCGRRNAPEATTCIRCGSALAAH